MKTGVVSAPLLPSPICKSKPHLPRMVGAELVGQRSLDARRLLPPPKRSLPGNRQQCSGKKCCGVDDSIQLMSGKLAKLWQPQHRCKFLKLPCRQGGRDCERDASHSALCHIDYMLQKALPTQPCSSQRQRQLVSLSFVLPSLSFCQCLCSRSLRPSGCLDSWVEPFRNKTFEIEAWQKIHPH